jgi:hypothetical protein
MRHHILTKFHEDYYRRSRNIKVLLRNLKGCNVGITDGRNLESALLRWAQVA